MNTKNVKDIRRENLRILAKSVGGISRLADRLSKNQSQISHLIGNNPIKNIGDRVAAQIEIAFKKPAGWLDQDQNPATINQCSDQIQHMIEAGVLCTQVPLISWEEAKKWDSIAPKYKPNPTNVIASTTRVGPLAFALAVYGDSMESPDGISFPENSIIIVDPETMLKPNAFVIVRIKKDRGATLKQFILQEQNRYLKPLNRRYPILSFTPETTIIGVVKQIIINFDKPTPSIPPAAESKPKKIRYQRYVMKEELETA